MDRQTVFTKTAKGMMEATGKTSVLSRDMRALLKEIDGKVTVGEVQARLGKVPEDKLHSALQALAKNDFIREFRQSQAAAPPPKPAEADIDLDFTTAIPTLSTLTKKAEEEAREKAQAAEAAARAQAEAAAKAKAEAEARAKAAAAAARARAEAEARAREEAERKAREAAERARKEAEERARREAEAQARREAEERARAEEAARIEAERRAQEAAERARKEAEERARREAEERARAEEAARLEAERREREEAERREREEAERRAREAAERARQEAEERARREAEEQARREAEERARAQEAARLEAERREREEAERIAREAAERARKEAEERARREAEEQARREAEERARAQEAARIEAERREREEAEREAKERAQREAEMQARREAEEYARAQEAARELAARKAREAEERARREQEAARLEAERREREEAERRAREAAERERKEADDRARREAQERARREQEAARLEAERMAKEAAQREREEAVARETTLPAAESAPSLDDAVKIETDIDAVLRASGGAPWDEPKRSSGTDDTLQKEAEERANREAEERANREAAARAREEAEAAAERAEDERRRREEEARAQERAPDQAGDAEHVWDHAEANALMQAQEAETERHFAEMEKVLEAEQLAATGEKRPTESHQLARKREQEEASERERAGAAARELEAEAELAAEAELETAPARIRTPVNWGRPVAVGLFLVLVLGLISIPFIPFDGYIPQFEKLASAYMQQPVKIKTLNLMLLPQPHWRMDDVSVGDHGQLSVARVNAIAELGSMFSDKKVFKSIELESPVLSEQGLLALLFGKPHGQDFKVAKIVATNGKLNSTTFNLPALDAIIAVGQKEGTWQTIALESGDHNTRLQLTRDGTGAHIEAHTNAFSMPLNPSFTLENFDATGVIHPGELKLSEFSGARYGGIISGNATLTWGADWSLRGEIRAKAVDPGKLAQKLIESGNVEGKATYALHAKSYAGLFAAPHLEGGFAVSKGTLLGVELGRFLQGGGVGGKSEFAELSGTFVQDAGKTQVRQIRLVSGPLSASGSADVDGGGHISGHFVVELKSSVAQARANLTLSGALGDPHFSR
ncbi:MAG: AsmA family protein [Burkholderiales bacterium]